MNEEKSSILDQIDYFIASIKIHEEAYHFFREHRLWEGFRKAGWAWKFSVLAALLISFRFLYMIYDWMGFISSTDEEIGIVKGALSLAESFNSFGKDLIHTSGLRYILLLFLEVIIFHFAVKTLNILENENRIPDLRDFIRAQIRMLKVLFRSWIYEIVLATIISIALGIMGASSIKMIFVFLVQCYFMGFAFLDNYNEQYGLKVNESAKIIRKYYGAAIGIGMVSYILFLIPLIGPIVAPILGAVTASLFMYNFTKPETERFTIDLV